MKKIMLPVNACSLQKEDVLNMCSDDLRLTKYILEDGFKDSYVLKIL